MVLRKRLIEVVEYDPSWSSEFAQESEALRAILSVEIIHIYHIGSTAVPGLKAKPTIDILLEVKGVEALDQYNLEMEKLGYVPKGENGIPGRRYYTKGGSRRTHHLHAFTVGSPEIERHIAFRDYLIAHPRVSHEYGELKSRNAEECDDDAERYCAAKNDFVKYHEQKALEWLKHK